MCIVMLNIKMGKVWILGNLGSKVGKEKRHVVRKHWEWKGEDVNHCTWAAGQSSKRLSVHLGQATC
jgi:hypothetical protein